MSKYDLLVLVWPIYDFNPGPTLTNYVKHVGDLNGTNTVILTIGGGINPFNAQNTMHNIVADHNGTIIAEQTLFRGGGNYTQRATEFATQIHP
jgi:hypothetical protein